ncbi:hypothetical protein B566_EDAN006176 [Ephemera danica]|nr:hypothetical protein B566_EDAN006176 [Ephemera danica]
MKILLNSGIFNTTQPYSSTSALQNPIMERAKICGEYEKISTLSTYTTQNKTQSMQVGFFLPKCADLFVSDISNLVTGDEHAKTCFGLNLLPAAIITQADIQCLKIELSKLQENSNSTGINQTSLDPMFLIAARELMDREFFVCPKAEILSFPRFLPGKPDNRLGNESCLAVVLGKDGEGLDDVSCSLALRFLCKHWSCISGCKERTCTTIKPSSRVHVKFGLPTICGRGMNPGMAMVAIDVPQ